MAHFVAIKSGNRVERNRSPAGVIVRLGDLVVTTNGFRVKMGIVVGKQSIPLRQGSRGMMISESLEVGKAETLIEVAQRLEEFVAALFRDPLDESVSRPKRPEPAHKHVVARFAETVLDGDRAVPIPAAFVAWTWAAAEIRRRRQPGQPLLRMCDGQETLWDAADSCAEPADTDAIEILDFLHVSSYVWSAARAFHPRDETAAEQFTRERLLRLLRGEVSGVIRGLRQMATQRRLRGTAWNAAACAGDSPERPRCWPCEPSKSPTSGTPSKNITNNPTSNDCIRIANCSKTIPLKSSRSDRRVTGKIDHWNDDRLRANGRVLGILPLGMRFTSDEKREMSDFVKKENGLFRVMSG